MLRSWRGLLLGCPVPPVHVLAAVYSSLEPQLRVAIPSTALWANQQPLLAQPACPLISTAARFASSSTGAGQRDGTSVSPAVPTKAERRAAAAQFSRQRAAWRRSVGALRMQWMAEHRDAVAALTASERAQKEQLKALQQLRSESKPADQAQADLERAIRDAERDVLLAMRRLASAHREELRRDTLARYRETRRAELEAASADWVPQDGLAARIDAALDKPRAL